MKAHVDGFDARTLGLAIALLAAILLAWCGQPAYVPAEDGTPVPPEVRR